MKPPEVAPAGSPRGVQVLPVHGLPELRPGDDLAALIAAAVTLHDGDVVVVAQKAISKVEGALVDVDPARDPFEARRALARRLARRVLADTPGVLVVETAHGLVCANAGVDASNAPDGQLVVLPADPDASAARLRSGLREAAGVTVAVIVSDTFGRAWRGGQTDVAIGLAGMPALRDERGGVDRAGRALAVTVVAVADQVAGAADLVRRKADGVPVVVVRGLDHAGDGGSGADLVRSRPGDLFAHGRGWLARALSGDQGARGAREPPLEGWERDLVLASAARGGAAVRWEGDALVVAGDGFAAGAAVTAAEAALLDLDYQPVRHVAGDRVMVRIAEPPAE